MFESFLERIVKNSIPIVVHDDKAYFIGGQGKSRNVMVVNDGKEKRYFKLSHGIPISDIENNSILLNQVYVDKILEDYLTNLKAGQISDIIEKYFNKYQILSFVLKELMPRLVNVPMLDREKGLNITEKEIIQKALGNLDKEEKMMIEIDTWFIETKKSLHKRAFQAYTIYGESSDQEQDLEDTISGKKSILNKTIARDFFLANKKIYFFRPHQDTSDFYFKFGRKILHPFLIGSDIEAEFSQRKYSHFRLGSVIYDYASNIEIISKLRLLEMLKKNLKDYGDFLKTVSYMPIMDLNEFQIGDVGYFWDKGKCYVYVQLPKFARQSTYDEEVFIGKEFDKSGSAGRLAIGLEAISGIIGYTGVKYVGPIKKDAPFSNLHEFEDPNLTKKWGGIRTVCHVAGYPVFPMSGDGFYEFLFYALGNFLDNMRKEFSDRHFDQRDRIAQMDIGVKLTREQALKEGYILTNIHKIKKE